MQRSFGAVAVVAGVLALTFTACGSSGSSGSGGAAPGGSKPTGGASLPACPLAALQTASKPVEITYWHAMTRANEDELKVLTAQFNAQQHDVKVSLSAAASYPDNFTRFKAGLSTGALPDLLQSEDTTTQAMIDSHAILPAASCLKADNASTSDFVPRVVAYYSVGGVLYPMPFNDSNPILYYNKAVFRKAGLDPDKPPVTFADVKADSQKIVQSRAAQFGLAFKVDSWPIEHWFAKSGATMVNNANGRDARATKVTFDDATGLSIFQWLDDMVKGKLAVSTGTADIDHYLAVGNGRAAMTIDTSAALGTIAQLFASGQYRDVELGVGAMPGPNSTDGGVLVGGAANYIMSHSTPAKQAAAYEFAKFLSAPKTQSAWAAATGYVPISRSAVALAPLAQRYAQQPEYKIAYDQLVKGAENAATAGPVVGAYGAKGEGLRGALIDGLSRMFDGRATPQQALAGAATEANTAIAEYNSRVGS